MKTLEFLIIGGPLSGKSSLADRFMMVEDLDLKSKEITTAALT
jgi:hypothetical protein